HQEQLSDDHVGDDKLHIEQIETTDQKRASKRERQYLTHSSPPYLPTEQTTSLQKNTGEEASARPRAHADLASNSGGCVRAGADDAVYGASSDVQRPRHL